MLKTFLTDENGATAIEYGLIAALVAVALIAAFTGLKGQVEGLFTAIGTKVAAQNPK